MGVLCVDLKSKIAAGHGLTWDPYVTMTFSPHKIAVGEIYFLNQTILMSSINNTTNEMIVPESPNLSWNRNSPSLQTVK
jgi:hypothetical protein